MQKNQKSSVNYAYYNNLPVKLANMQFMHSGNAKKT